MDPGAMSDHPPPAPPTLRKRPISVDTSRPGADGAASREEAPCRHMPGQGAREEGEREAAGSVSMASAPGEDKPGEEAAARGREDDLELEAGEPMSPAGRLFRQTHFNCYIVAVIGLGAAVDVAAVRVGLEATLARHPRFSSVQVKDDVKRHAKPRWVRTTVNLDNHVIIPRLDPTATSANPDRAVEDYLSRLSTAPMDHSRPLWELHLLDFPTSETASTAVLRMHHSLGDGVSLLSLLIACTRSAADPARLPELPPAPRRAGPVHARPRPPLSAGPVALLLWAWSYAVLAWHTMVDVARFIATALFLRDPRTPFMAASEGVEFRRKRFVHRTLSLDDVKFVKHAMKCTVNDVLIGVTNAGLSRYYFRKTSDTNNERKKSQKNICVRSALLVNIRKAPGLHAAAALCYGMFTNTTMSFSSMVGPVEKVEFYGHPIVYIAPSVYGHPHALTVHYQSYMNSIKLVLAVDDAQFPDSHQLLDDFAESLRLIRQAASTR
nr:unnamed protein product [Digitaria exilis]